MTASDAGFVGNQERKVKSNKTSPMHLSRPKMTVGALLVLGTTAVLAFSFIPIQNSTASETREGGYCDGCHGGADTDSLLTYSGLPTTYTPRCVYPITIQITDGAGLQSFDLIVSAGTLSNPSANAEINDVLDASANDGVDLSSATTFTVDWNAPASGSVTFDFWGVSGDGASGLDDPWDHDSVPIADVPEFPALLMPVLGMIGAVLVVSVLAKRAKQ